jgi:hypothetical protein
MRLYLLLFFCGMSMAPTMAEGEELGPNKPLGQLKISSIYKDVFEKLSKLSQQIKLLPNSLQKIYGQLRGKKKEEGQNDLSAKNLSATKDDSGLLIKDKLTQNAPQESLVDQLKRKAWSAVGGDVTTGGPDLSQETKDQKKMKKLQERWAKQQKEWAEEARLAQLAAEKEAEDNREENWFDFEEEPKKNKQSKPSDLTQEKKSLDLSQDQNDSQKDSFTLKDDGSQNSDASLKKSDNLTQEKKGLLSKLKFW